MERPKLKIQRVADVPLPHYEHEGDAGLDLYAAEEQTLQPGERKLISSGIKIAVPNGYEAQVRPKSGLALKHGLSIVNTPGTIDEQYRGIVKIILINHSTEPYTVEKDKKIAQMVINKIEHPDIEEVTELDETSRGEGGFGSTGLDKK
jgi:dUTP pyrophosphatase